MESAVPAGTFGSAERADRLAHRIASSTLVQCRCVVYGLCMSVAFSVAICTRPRSDFKEF